MASNSGPSALGGTGNQDSTSPTDGSMTPEVLDSMVNDLQLQLGFGQHPHGTFDLENTSENPQTVTFLQYRPQPGGSNTSRNTTYDLKREKKRARDHKYRQKEKERRVLHNEEIQQLKKEKAILEDDLRKLRETVHLLEEEIARHKKNVLQLQAEKLQPQNKLHEQNEASVSLAQPDGPKNVDLEQRYEVSKRENALLKKKLKQEKKEKRAMENAFLDRILKLENIETQDIDPSSSYSESEHSTV